MPLNLTGHNTAPQHPTTNYHLRSLTCYVDTNTAISDALLYSNDPIHEEWLTQLIGFFSLACIAITQHVMFGHKINEQRAML